MMRHLTPADYRSMPWANGRGMTVEMLRVDEGGALKWRLSRAGVVEDGDFSVLAGIQRNLTVISGPGFDLEGPMGILAARPLVPVAFAGDLAVRAVRVTAPSDDFNVMTAQGLALPQVQVIRAGATLSGGSTVVVFALEPALVNGQKMAPLDMIVTDTDVTIAPGGLVIAVRLYG